jgi:hypothetical protein
VNGTSYTCSNSPLALVEEWPAFGVYSEGSCESPLLVAAYRPGCSDWSNLYGSATSEGTSTLASCDDKLFEFDLYNDTATCQITEGQGSWAHYELPTNQCHEMTQTPALSAVAASALANSLISLSGVIDSSFTLTEIGGGEWYTYSSCSGASSLPGIKSSNDDSTAASYGGLTSAGFFSLLAMGTLLCIGVTAFGCYRLTQEKKRKTDSHSLREKLSKQEEEMVPL